MNPVLSETAVAHFDNDSTETLKPTLFRQHSKRQHPSFGSEVCKEFFREITHVGNEIRYQSNKII